MSDRMQPIEFQNLLYWIVNEYHDHKTIFGIPFSKFFFKINNNSINIFNERLDMPIGPAAGPHTQLAQNIIASYLVGGRFFELKTVQKLDELKIDKPCIDAEDEGYNVEWSQELTLEQSYSEYLKAWFILHFLNSLFHFSINDAKSFVFNMSVGYDLDGIKSGRMDKFIENLKDASKTNEFQDYKKILTEVINNEKVRILLAAAFSDETTSKLNLDKLASLNENITPFISNSVTLSTMHGCPSNEIEAIAKYLIKEKGLHTYIKLNPTLLGYNYVKDVLSNQGYNYIELDETAFTHDLQFDDAIPMITRLKEFALLHKKDFGVKLSNTLGVNNRKGSLPGGQMYMSGRSLYSLTVNLAYRIANEFNGELNISFSGGVNIYNIHQILDTGIYPVTLVTELLKPGGYLRLTQISNLVEGSYLHSEYTSAKINLTKLKTLADDSLSNIEYKKSKRSIGSLKINKRLPKYDCYISPCMEVCPINQDVAEYINSVKEKNYINAYEIITEKNPLPNITGNICDHQCMDKCARWDYEGSVEIRELKKEAAEKGFSEYIKNIEAKSSSKKNGIKTAIIGAGPSGLSAAYFLSKAGFDVTIFEQTEKAGGTVQHVIPGFRLPESAIENDIELIKKFGVKIKYNCDPNFSISELNDEGYKYIFIGIGAANSNQFIIKSDDEDIYDAVEFLKSFNQNKKIKLGENIAVIGGGNSAMDAARASLRTNGVKKVFIIYRRTKQFMPADLEEFEACIKEGIEFKELLLPVEFQNKKLKCQKMQLGEIGKDGRRKVFPIENEFEIVEIDSIISAIGEHVDLDILRQNKIVELDKNSLGINDQTNETIINNVYIGGDALRGPSTVVESIADGKKAAQAIIDKEGIEVKLTDVTLMHSNKADHIKSIEDKRGNILLDNFSDINLEASKCLECNLLCNKCVEVCPNRANIAIKTDSNGNELKDFYQILHMDGLCNECGNCETFCPYSDSPYKVKTTLFWTEEDFMNSNNDGFYFYGENNSLNNFKIRYNSRIGDISMGKSGRIAETSFKEDSNEFRLFTNFIGNIFKKYNYLMSADK